MTAEIYTPLFEVKNLSYNYAGNIPALKGINFSISRGELVALVGVLLDTIPTPLQSLFGTVLRQLPISVCNTICTNVHGPSTPLYLLGHKMLAEPAAGKRLHRGER